MNKPMPAPFQLYVPDSAVYDLTERLSRTRLPDEPPMSEPWSTGASLAFMVSYIGNGPHVETFNHPVFQKK